MRSKRLLSWIVGFAIGSAAASPSICQTAPSPSEVVRVRELYVPYSEFHARSGDDPNGVVMTLDEYRGLVLTALEKAKTSPPPPLPPVEAVVSSASYSGALAGKTARFRASLKVRVAADGWVRCDLGAPLPQLGSVAVDGEPGWLVIEDAPFLKESPRRAHLLLRGKGDHDVALVFSLPAVEKDDLWSIEGPLAVSAASSVALEVPGQVDARSEPPFLDTVPVADRTRLTLAAGNASRFRVEWRRKTAGESELFLAAEHRVLYSPRRDSPAFLWEAVVTIARRKTDALTFTEPPGGTVVKVEGPLVHGWERTQAGLRVVLNQSVDGEVRLRFSGVLDAAGDRFVLAVPSLAGASSNTGWIAAEEPSSAKLLIESAVSAAEVSPAEAGLAVAAIEGKKSRGARVFAFTDTGARVTARLADLAERHEARAAYVLRAGDSSASLEGLVRVTAREGRVWQLGLSVPEPWRLVSLEEALEAGKEKSGHGLRHEEPAGADRVSRIDLERALEADEALELRVRFEHGAYGDDRSWQRKAFDAVIPAIARAERTRIDLGIAIPPSIDALVSDLPGWRSLSAEEASSLGLGGAVAALTTRDPASRLAVTLVHRSARGEYRLVLHLLALEKQLRARADIQLAVVDRPIDEVVFRLPVSAGENTVILGEGIKEVTTDAATGRRTARFSKPWLGTRQFRIEYEAAHTPGQAAAIPVIEVEAPSASGGFGSERFVVLQSRGPVELETRAGPGLTPADVDDVPGFAEPWSGGRVLTAYRFKPSGDPGTLVTVVHERAPVLKSLARELKLSTVIGREGVSRTRAEILLAYSQESHLSVRLPQGARCLAVSVNDAPVRSVRPGAAKEDLAIPLPPQSYATIALVYERPDASAVPPIAAGALGLVGTWHEEALVLPDVPVGETTWSIYYPDDYRFLVEGGNARALDPRFEERGGSFVDSFIARLLRGKAPLFTSFASESPASRRVAVPALTPEEALGAEGTSAKDRAAEALLAPKASAGETGVHEKAAAPSYRLIPQGRSVEASKLGSGAVIELAYRSLSFEGFARRSIFLATLLAGIALAFTRGWRACSRFVFWGLLAGITVPLALGWKSPLVAVPFCEGLAVLIAIGIVVLASRALRALFRRRSAMGTVTALCLFFLIGAEARALPIDGVLIPYDPASPGLTSRGGDKVYIPRSKFLELWNIAHPEQALFVEATPVDFVLGSAEYRLGIDGDAYRIMGKLTINVLTDRWVSLRLPFDGQIVKATIDGADAGVAQAKPEGNSGSVPLIELKGHGKRVLEVELTGPILREPGAFKVATRVLVGSAGSLTAELPAGARAEAPQAVLAKEDGGKTLAVIDLGGSDRIDLAWSFPKIERQAGSQSESKSYSLLTLTPGGYAVDRVERLRVTGRPVDGVEYRVLGGWQVTQVAGAGVSAWSVVKDAGAADAQGLRLRVAFAKPVPEAELRIRGRASLDGTAPLASLALEGAARQESFVGLRHAAARRFAPQVLAGMLRASREELLAAFAVPPEQVPDRVYHAFKSGEGETIAAEAVTGETSIATSVVAVVMADRLAVTARSRYTVTGPGPLRHVVPLPPGWAVRTVKSEAMRSWEVVDSPAGRLFTVHFKERAAGGTEVLWSADRQIDALPDPIELPAVRGVPAAGTTARETLEWAAAASEELDLAVRAAERLVPVSLESAASHLELPPGASYRFAFRSARADGAEPLLRLGATRRSSLLGAAVVSFARLAEDFLHVNARVIFKTRLAGRDRFRLQLPPGAELVSVEARNQRSREVTPAQDGAVIEVQLQSPVTGEQPIDVSYRVPRQGAVPPAILPVRVFDGATRLAETDQYVGVIQTGATFTSAAKPDGLVPSEAASLPYLPEGISAASLKPVYRSVQLEWSLLLEERLIEVARGPAAVVEIAEITTNVGDDGTARSRAVYTVRNRGLQFLLIEMPQGSTLWGVTLNGKPAAVGESTPAAGGGRRLRVPIEHVGSASLSLEVAVQYEERPLGLPALRGSASLAAPRVVDTEVVETVWNLHFPEGYTISRSGGNLREVAASVLYAKKAGNLLEQLEKISKAASESDSQRVREQATREMARIEQSLGDNLAELTVGNRDVKEQARAVGIGQSDLEVQWAANDAIIERSRKAQESLRQVRADHEKTKQAKEPPSKEEQGFLDTTNYLKRAWRDNRAAQGATASSGKQPASRPSEAVSMEGLLEAPLRLGLGADGAVKDADVASPSSIDAARGLKPLPDAAGAGAAPGLEAPQAKAAGASYTFVNQGGEAQLGITFTRNDAAPRASALAALLLLPALAAWWSRRSRSVHKHR